MINKLISILKFLMLGIPKLIFVAILQIVSIFLSFGSSLFITDFLFQHIKKIPINDLIIPIGLLTLAFTFLSVAGINKITKTDLVLRYTQSYYFMAKGKSEPKSVKESIQLFLKLSCLFFVLYFVSFILYLLVF